MKFLPNSLSNRINDGSRTNVNFCSIDQFEDGYFLRVWWNQHVTIKAKNKNMNLKLISNDVYAGLNVLICKKLLSIEMHFGELRWIPYVKIQFVDIVALVI